MNWLPLQDGSRYRRRDGRVEQVTCDCLDPPGKAMGLCWTRSGALYQRATGAVCLPDGLDEHRVQRYRLHPDSVASLVGLAIAGEPRFGKASRKEGS